MLGVDADASDEELRAAWRAAVRALHPDTRDDDIPPHEADAALRLVNDAWALVGDPDRRQAFDAGLSLDFDPEDADAPEWWMTRAAPRGPTGLVRHAWWVVVLAVLLAIFVLTAYAGAPAGPLR